MTLGMRLRLARHHRGWSQEELARQAGVRPATISHIERDRSTGRRVARQLAEALGVAPGWLLVGTEAPLWAPSSTTALVRRIAESEPEGYRAELAVGWRLLGQVSGDGAFHDGSGQLRPRSGLSVLRVADRRLLRGLPAPGLLLLDQHRAPEQGDLCAWWPTEDRVTLVQYCAEEETAGFVLVPADGTGEAVGYRPGERPLRLYPVLGILGLAALADRP